MAVELTDDPSHDPEAIRENLRTVARLERERERVARGRFDSDFDALHAVCSLQSVKSRCVPCWRSCALIGYNGFVAQRSWRIELYESN